MPFGPTLQVGRAEAVQSGEVPVEAIQPVGPDSPVLLLVEPPACGPGHC